MKPQNDPHDPPRSILIIDDDTVNLEMMRLIFSCYGIECQTASSGLEGIKAATNGGGHSAILLDIALPDISGVEVFKKLRDDYSMKYIPIIAVSALAMIHDIDFFMSKCAFCDYITKPIDISNMIERMRFVSDHCIQNKKSNLSCPCRIHALKNNHTIDRF
jgi:CheY-like chemotaxis protein